MEGQISIDDYLSTGFPAVVDAVDTVTLMVGKAWALIASNPLLLVYAASGLLSVGIGFLVYLRWASRH